MNYVFFTDEDEDEYAIAFGYGSMYNHQHENNAYWTIDRDSLSITFKALKIFQKDLKFLYPMEIIIGQVVMKILINSSYINKWFY